MAYTGGTSGFLAGVWLTAMVCGLLMDNMAYCYCVHVAMAYFCCLHVFICVAHGLLAALWAIWPTGRMHDQLAGCVTYWHDMWLTRGLLSLLRGCVACVQVM